MGLLTLQEFREELLTALKQRDDIAAAQLNRWINMAYLHLCAPEVRQHQELKADFTIPLVANTDVYDISAVVDFHVLGITEVTYYGATTASNTAQRHDVRPRDLQWFQDHTIPTASGGPRQYLWRGTEIRLSPVPTTSEAGNVIQIHCWREPEALVDDATTVLTNYWDHVLVLGAQAIAEYRLGYRELAIATNQLYAQMINEKRAGDELQAEDTGFEMEFERESYM